MYKLTKQYQTWSVRHTAWSVHECQEMPRWSVRIMSSNGFLEFGVFTTLPLGLLRLSPRCPTNSHWFQSSSSSKGKRELGNSSQIPYWPLSDEKLTLRVQGFLMEGSLNPLQSTYQLQLWKMMHKAFREICHELSGMEAQEEVDWMMEEHSQHCIWSCGVCKYEDRFQCYCPSSIYNRQNAFHTCPWGSDCC
jgi:hypothetical protein